ncbi:T9SS type A sorting domain-containing protein [Dyadobacter sp. CY345]|uniref:TIM-barrel domain-containing protein n=1 Tax=Dyadobacter sp. CY345 TaxID=2909335 RepID=UPI001F35F29D|nr:TIM-barrel domain-containing protein [Dyadobacter sp. CY345]MCF2444442.1 T9SS type A sorting domain-containing protein [Dyadobacter sp. CY345]
MNKFYWFLFLIFFYDSSYGQSAGNFVGYEKSGESLIVQGTSGVLKIQAITSEIFKVQFLNSKTSLAFDSSYTVNLKSNIGFDKISESNNSIQLLFQNCSLEINKIPLSIALKSGNEVKIEDDQGIRYSQDSVFLSFRINPSEVFHGAGGRPFGPDLNKKAFEFYNTWEHAYYDQATGLSQSFNVPFIISSHKYGLLLDSDQPGMMRMYVGSLDSTRLNIEILSAGRWAYYLIHGDSNDKILENYTLLTGRQPLPPRWALGYIQSKFGYKNQSEATNAVSKLQNQGFPLDAVGLDLYWYGDETKMGTMDWYAPTWPSPEDMMTRLKAKGVKTILITDPYISTKSDQYQSAETLSLFAKRYDSGQTYTQDIWNGTVGLLDIFKPETQTWLWEKYKKLSLQGVGGWWTDKIEPDYHPFDAYHILGNARQVHNLYSLFWSGNLFEHYKKDFPEKRLFNLTRSGWTGSQRYGVLPWSGDVARYWAGLKLQIPIIVQAGMSGLAYMHSDIGGFATMSDKTDKDEELDLRWFQFGTFSPITRNHGQRPNPEPFNLSEPFYSIVKNYLNIRYQLLPYTYSLAWKNSISGRPICMPMDYFENRKNLGDINDQYFFGENMIVAPVLLHGMPSRKVVLPGGKWFNFWTDEMYEGNKNIFPTLTVEHIPVYAKAGSFIPLSSSKKRSTDFYTSDSLTVKFFQDISTPSSTFSMFHDDGIDPNSLTNGKYELVDFTGRVSADSIQITTVRKKSFEKSIAKRNLVFEIKNLTSPPVALKINGKDYPVVQYANEFTSASAYYNLANKELKIRYDWECKDPLIITITRDGLGIITATEPPKPANIFTVYPNPGLSRDPLSVKIKFVESGDYSLEVFNNTGTIVAGKQLGKQQNGTVVNFMLDVKKLKGAYIFKLSNEKGKIQTKTIVIE